VGQGGQGSEDRSRGSVVDGGFDYTGGIWGGSGTGAVGVGGGKYRGEAGVEADAYAAGI